ncbi:MAG: DUF4294 domain-containing protein [Paludibacter sp.]
MIFFRLNKSQVLAAGITVLVNVAILSLLFISPGSNFLSTSKNDSEEDMAIQFQMLEQLSLPPAQPQKTQTVSVKSTQTKVYEKTADESEDRSSESEEEALPPMKDTVMMTEIKKVIEDIKINVPQDSTIFKPDIIALQNIIPTKVAAKKDEYQNAYENAKFYNSNYRMIKNIRFLYPYVLKVKQVVSDMNTQLTLIKDDQEKRKLIKKTEKELFSQFEKDVRKMSYSQGKILLKLIARETNETAYSLIKTYKGGLPADFWYTVGMVFQENLKTKYDSLGEDAMLEKVVKKYKNGELKN